MDSLLWLAGFALCAGAVIYSFAAGRIPTVLLISRQNNPVLFWSFVGVYFIAGLIALGMAVRLMS